MLLRVTRTRPISAAAPISAAFALLSLIAASLSLLVPLRQTFAAPAGGGPRASVQEVADDWPRGWISDVPSVDLTGDWVFLPERSDPMLEVWRDREVSYRIDQYPTHIVLEFRAQGGASNTQTYRWDGTVHRFERDTTEVEEMARWTAAGRELEVEGRWWESASPAEVHAYAFRYSVAGNVLSFVQRDDSGTTTWRFLRQRR